MEVRFNVTKEERKALVTAVSEITNLKAEYQGAPSFAFKVGSYSIDKVGTLTCEAETDAGIISTLLTALEERGFVPTEIPDGLETAESESVETEDGESADESVPQNAEEAPKVVSGERGGEEESHITTLSGADNESSKIETTSADATSEGVTVIETPDKLVIEMPRSGFTQTAIDNLEKMVSSKSDLILKALGVPETPADDLPIHYTESTLRFPWFPFPASKEAIDAYGKFVCALCELAKKQKRVTMKDRDADPDQSDKFAFRCFLLRLGFTGNEYKSARKVLLSKLSGSGSFKRGNHKKSAAPDGSKIADSGDTNPEAIAVREGEQGADSAANEAPRLRCDQCRRHCYYSDGQMLTGTGETVDTSKRTPDKYTHYCLATPSGFRKIKHAAEWSGCEDAPAWCPLTKAASNALSSGEEAAI